MGTFLDAVAPSSSEPSAPVASGAPKTFLDATSGAVGAVSGAVGGALNRLGAPRLIDILDRPRQTAQAAIAGDDPLRTFLHHAGADQQDRDRAAVRAKMGLPGDAERAQGHGFRGGLDDFATDTVTDPMSLLGGFAVRGVGKALGAAWHLAGNATTLTSPQFAADAAKIGRAIGDKFTYGGSAKRELGTPAYDNALAADNRQASREEEAARRLTERFDKHIAPLGEDDKRTVYQVLNGERQITDPASGRVIVSPHIAAAVAEGRKLTNDMAALQGNASARRRLAYGNAPLAEGNMAARVEPWQLSYGATRPRTQVQKIAAMTHSDDAQRGAATYRVTARDPRSYALPDDLKEFAAPEEQGILGALNLRSKYLPGPHIAAAVAADQPAHSFNLLRPFAPNALQRDEFQVGDKPEELAALDDAFRGAARNAARQGTAGKLRAEVGAPLDLNAANREPTALEQLFERKTKPTGDKRSELQIAGDWWKQIVDIPKNTVTTLGLAHGLKNVPALALASEGPGAALEALVQGAKIARKGAADRYEALRPAIEGGVVTPFAERENPIADALARLPGPIGHAIGAASKGANALTWAIDDAAKQAVLKRKLARGMDPNEAAAQTMREMVDYRHRSAATEIASNFAPFATFRTRIPAADASATSRNPQRLLALDRATQGLFSNGNVQIGTHDDGTPRKFTMTTPTSDVLGGVDEPQKYARAMVADPIKALLTGLHVGMPSKRYDAATRDFTTKMQPDYFTYGQPLLPHYDEKQSRWKSGFLASQAAGYVPASIGQDVLGGLGIGEYKPEDFLSALLGGALGVHVR